MIARRIGRKIENKTMLYLKGKGNLKDRNPVNNSWTFQTKLIRQTKEMWRLTGEPVSSSKSLAQLTRIRFWNLCTAIDQWIGCYDQP